MRERSIVQAKRASDVVFPLPACLFHFSSCRIGISSSARCALVLRGPRGSGYVQVTSMQGTIRSDADDELQVDWGTPVDAAKRVLFHEKLCKY
jgi:hypothetical protein